MRLPFNYNRWTGATTTFSPDPDRPGAFHLTTTYDREPILEHCAYMRNQVQQKGELRKIGSIPEHLYWQLIREGKLGHVDPVRQCFVVDTKKLTTLLNDRDYSNLKCVDGRV